MYMDDGINKVCLLLDIVATNLIAFVNMSWEVTLPATAAVYPEYWAQITQ